MPEDTKTATAQALFDVVNYNELIGQVFNNSLSHGQRDGIALLVHVISPRPARLELIFHGNQFFI
jgi:hypothetical protein